MQPVNFDSIDKCLNYANSEESYGLCTNLLAPPPPKRPKTREFLGLITFSCINASLGKPKLDMIKILIDSGSTGTSINSNLVINLHTRNDVKTTWHTAAGNFKTGGRV